MTKADQLVQEASRWIGTKEVGENHGPEVEKFQMAIDGHASGQAWCASFVFYCLQNIGGSDLFQSSHVLTCWNKSPKTLRRTKPEKGSLMVWKKKGSSQGHIGIVIDILDDGRRVVTVEGNTGPLSIVSREGDGVYKKFRSPHPVIGNLEVLGYLSCWFKDE